MMASLSNEKRDLPMRRIEVSGHIAQAVAMDYIATAARSNPNFEDRSVCGWDVEFRECHPADKRIPTNALRAYFPVTAREPWSLWL